MLFRVELSSMCQFPRVDTRNRHQRTERTRGTTGRTRSMPLQQLREATRLRTMSETYSFRPIPTHPRAPCRAPHRIRESGWTGMRRSSLWTAEVIRRVALNRRAPSRSRADQVGRDGSRHRRRKPSRHGIRRGTRETGPHRHPQDPDRSADRGCVRRNAARPPAAATCPRSAQHP